MLIQKDDQGNWSLKGVPWHKLRSGSILDDETNERLYGALWRLMEYEDTGLDPEQVQELAEKRRPKKPRMLVSRGGKGGKYCVCPQCGGVIGKYIPFCRSCGQSIRWEDRDELKEGEENADRC